MSASRVSRVSKTGTSPKRATDPARWFARFKRAAVAWWRSHPARLGVELATPVLSGYAARKPAQFLGIAAAVGAIVMVARPWRLISVTGLIVALLKSSQLSSVVMSAMSAADFKKDHEPTTMNECKPEAWCRRPGSLLGGTAIN